MIHVERGPAPKALSDPKIEAAKKALAAMRQSSLGAPADQMRFVFVYLFEIPEVRAALFSTFERKCAYCETNVYLTTFAELDFFRPRMDAISLTGEQSSVHYWWLAYEWSNLFLSCNICAKLKGSRFPVKGERVPPGTMGDGLLLEEPLLLNPCVDHPEEDFVFDDNGVVASQTEQGRVTIDILNLNRAQLTSQRLQTLEEMRLVWPVFVKALDRRTSQKTSRSPVQKLREALYSTNFKFLALRRQFLQHWSLETVEKKPQLESGLQEFLTFRTAVKKHLAADDSAAEASIKDVVTSAADQPAASVVVQSAITDNVSDFQAAQQVQESYSLEDDDRKEDYYRKARFIERVEIRNFKVIEHLDLNFKLGTSVKGSWLLLLGENGMGKSSILQAIALALSGDEARGLIGIEDASKYVKYGHSEGYVRVHLTGSIVPIELTFKTGSKDFRTNTPAPKILLLAYGATRLLPRKESRVVAGSPFTRPFNLFNPLVALRDANAWLSELWDEENPGPFNEAATVIKELFMLHKKDCLFKEEGKSVISIEGPTFGGTVHLSDLSAGYESVLALLTDVVGTLNQLWPSMESAEGLVLVDEIDAHLHPRWKMAIIPRLRTCFPQVQFLVTSHEPLTLRSLKADEIAIMERDEHGKVFAITEDLPEPRALRIEQLLTSEFFGLSSTIDSELEKQYEEYYALLGQRKRNKTENARLELLKDELDKFHQFGTTERERVVLEAADKFLADRKARPKERKSFKPETQKVIKDLWKNF